jgi:hypothetical protein
MIVTLLLIGIYFLFGESLGISSIFLLIFFFILCILLCLFLSVQWCLCFFLKCIYQSSWIGYVHCRIFFMDRNVSYRPSNPLDAPESYPRRNILLVCRYVRSLYTYCLETCSRNDRKVIGGNRTLLDQFQIEIDLNIQYIKNINYEL